MGHPSPALPPPGGRPACRHAGRARTRRNPPHEPSPSPRNRRMMNRAFLLAVAVLAAAPLEASASTYYVRQPVGNDSSDGLSPDKAWRSISKLSSAMQAGDTAY